ncbi:MAG: cytochrome c biogenesis CcdA family protein, partial [Dehalococcoidia bacterium]
IPFLMRSRQALTLHGQPAGYAGATLIGVSFAVAWTPCVGAILGAILTLASTAEGAGQGIVLLTAYSAGLGIPFLLSSLTLGGLIRVFGRYKRYLRVVHVGGGVFLILVGILILTGYFTLLNAYAIKLTPKWIWNRI